MKQVAIEIKSLQKTYRAGLWNRRAVEALKEVSFGVERGSIFGLLGPNGAGKTTLIKILLGLVSKTGGSAVLLDRPAGDRHGRQQVGYLPEHHRIPRHLTGNTALSYYGGLSGMSPAEVKRKRGDLLARAGLSDFANMSVKRYSKGMQQRLGLAQAMLHDPELLILDEPTDGVDPVGRSDMRSLLQELKESGKTIFINSHLLQEVELVCDRVAILVEGTLRQEGSVSAITERTHPDVEFAVLSTEQRIREIFAEVEPAPGRFVNAEPLRFTVPAPSQAQVSRYIDQLRQNDIDIVAVTPLRDSLEDVFLNVVSGNNNSTSEQKSDSPPS